jgi:ornithine carbamoyltransferase
MMPVREPALTTSSISPTRSLKSLLSIADLSAAEIVAIFKTASTNKSDGYRSASSALAGKAIILLFEKPSLRTRVTFELGPQKLGASTMYLDHSGNRIGTRESLRDYAKNLERWVDAIVARVYSHPTLEQLSAQCRVPVVNALSDLEHPCQALADFFTLQERLGSLRGRRLAFIGDGNNVCHSLMLGSAILGVRFCAICPGKYEPLAAQVERARAIAGVTGGSIEVTNDPGLVEGADAVYTDTWISMGDENEAQRRRRAFARYQVNEDLMRLAGPRALFMHCLPAHRGEEVTDDVIDSPVSIVYDQAENRMHVQNSLLVHTLNG